MSQAKVDQYKKEKANRKKTVAKDRAKRLAATICGWAVVVAIVCWAGVTGYQYYESKVPAKTYFADLSAMNDYLDTLDAE